MKIELSKLVKTYPRAEKPALDIAQLTLRGGTIHGILGHSGSGKSTLLNILALLDQPDARTEAPLKFYQEPGEEPLSYQRKKIRGQEGKQYTLDQWRNQYYSFIFQSGYLLENFSVLDNVLMPTTLQRSVTKDDIAQAEEALLKLDIQKPLWDALPRHLSGGQYQRVAVVRSLAHNPRVLFADEPTGSLDPRMGQKVMECLQEWREQDEENLLILVTHNPEHVEQYCDRYTVLSSGEVILDGKKDQYDFLKVKKAMSGVKTK